ncbi:hypothetical protein ABT324_24200 [Saccharopolyspora sp. NPDC000359]|uniref:hypothetical protein n=1 Tax=Saccharopolyspora sp. NPDC000359 TaxID=3154251 RepID=UPI00332E902D
MNDPYALLNDLDSGVAVDALRDVLGLTPPPMHPGDDPELHAILTDGWTTCLETVRRTIADKLGGAR